MEQELEKSASIGNPEIFEKKDDKAPAFKSIGRVFFEAFYQWAFGKLPDNTQESILVKPHQENVQEDEVSDEISQEFDRYLNNNVWKFAVEFIENGYEPSKKQYPRYNKMLSEVIKNNDNFVSDLTKIMSSIPADVMLLIIDNNDKAISDLFDLEQEIPNNVAVSATIKLATSDGDMSPYAYKKVTDRLLNNLSKNDIPHILNVVGSKIQNQTADLLDNLKIEHTSIGCIGSLNSEKVKKFTTRMENYFQLINVLSTKLTVDDLEWYSKNITSIEHSMTTKAKKIASCHDNGAFFPQNYNYLNINMFKKFHNKTQELIQNALTVKKDEVLRKIKSINGDKILEKKINTSIHTNNISVKQELSIEAQEILKSINQKYDNIANCSISDEDGVELKKLYEVRIPEVLKKFLVIDKEYRVELKNVQGKNAHELMIESLKNIEDILEAKLIEVNENRLSDLSVTQRYTSAIKTRKIN